MRTHGYDIFYLYMHIKLYIGTRVVDNKSSKTIGSKTFTCWGQSTNEYNQPYLTFACSIGMKKEDVDGFADRLDKCLNKFVIEKQKLLIKNEEQ